MAEAVQERVEQAAQAQEGTQAEAPKETEAWATALAAEVALTAAATVEGEELRAPAGQEEPAWAVLRHPEEEPPPRMVAAPGMSVRLCVR